MGGLIAAAAIFLALFAAPASAQDYPPGGPTVTLDDTTVAQGADLSGSVSGFEAGTATAEYNPTFTFPVVADGTGAFSTAIAADQAPGDYTLTVTSGSTTATADFTVVAAGTGGEGGDLPRTGSDSSLPMAQAAVAAVAAGGLMILVARRKATSA